ncbi:hypothetical protein [Geodermatophilus sp. SYSU D00696]
MVERVSGRPVEESSPPGSSLSRRRLFRIGGTAGVGGIVGGLGVLAVSGQTGAATEAVPKGSGGIAVDAPPPSGGDDSASLGAVCVGNREVHLQAGVVYRLEQPDVLSANGFSGQITGHGATLHFAYAGPWGAELSAINGLSDLTCRDLVITAPGANLFSVFRDCAGLRLEDVTVRDCSPKLTYAMPRDFAARRIRWVSSPSEPAVVDGSLYVPDAGRFSLIDFDFDSRFTGQTGAVVSAVATEPRPGTTVHVSHGRAFAGDQPAHTADGFIDIEPRGAVPFDSVTVRDVVLYNTSCYLTGARSIDVDGCTIRYTANNASGRAIPFVVYNNNSVKPQLGSLRISNCTVDWSGDNPTDQPIGILAYQSQPGAIVMLTRNSYRFGSLGGQDVQSLYWVRDGAPDMMVIDGDVIVDVDDTLDVAVPLVRTDSTVGRFVLRNSSVEGSFGSRLAVTAQGGGGDGALVAYENNDFGRANFRAPDFVDGSVTISRSHSSGNAGIEY